MTPALEQLAGICGVQSAYEDAFKHRRSASVESLLAVLNALGVGVTSLDDVPRALAAQQTAQLERGIEPVVVAWDGDPLEFDLTLPAQGSNRPGEVGDAFCRCTPCVASGTGGPAILPTCATWQRGQENWGGPYRARCRCWPPTWTNPASPARTLRPAAWHGM